MKIRLFPILLTYLLTSCVRDDVGISNALKGQWNWIQTCGGVVGCVHSTSDNKMTLKISETDVVKTVSNKNGITSTSSSYQLIDRQDQDGNAIYRIKFTDGTIWIMTVNKGNLSIGTDFIFSYYNRIGGFSSQ